MSTPYLFILIGILAPSIMYAQTLSDVPKTDPNHTAIKQSIKNGYLPLHDNNMFLPNNALSRRETAIIINRLETHIKNKIPTLTHTDITDLNQFINSYKQNYTQNKNTQLTLEKTNKSLTQEQKILHQDLAQLHLKLSQQKDDISHLNKQLSKQKKTVYILLAITGILGIIF